MSIIKGVSAHFECASDLFRLGGLVRILTTALLCGCSASMATAGVNEFTELGPEGGLVNEIAFHPLDASIAYVGTGSGFYRSSNGGATWQLVSDSFINIPSDVAVHPTSPNHVFVVSSGGGLYSSTDDGLTLNQVSTLPSMATTGEVEVGSDGTLYVSTSDRLFWSDNLGATWHESSPVPPTDTAINLLRVDPSHPETVYVRTASTSIFRSDDRGSNWTAIDVPAVAGVNDIAIAGTVPARIWLATTAGVWSKLDAGDASWESMPIGAAFLTVDVNPSDPSKVYAGTSAGLYASEDAGGHWFIVNDGSHTGQFTTLAIAPSAPTQLLLGGFGGMEGSLDAGIHWVSRNSGVLGANVQTLYAAAASDRIYVQTSHNGLQFIDGETLSLAQLDNQELRAFHALPSLFGTRAVHVVSEAPDELLLAIGPGIARSLDGGESWQLQSVPAFVSEGVRSVESAIVEDAPVFLALTSAGLYRSTDQGISWPKV